VVSGCTVGGAIVGTVVAVMAVVLLAVAASVTSSGVNADLRNGSEPVAVSVTVSTSVGSTATAAGVGCWANCRVLMIPEMRIAINAPIAAIAIIKGSPMARLGITGEVRK